MAKEEQNGEVPWVSRQAEIKIVYKLTLLGEQHCKPQIDEFNECCKGRSVSMVWACKKFYEISQDCMHKYMNDDKVAIVKRRWVAAGRPTHADWDALLEGMEKVE